MLHYTLWTEASKRCLPPTVFLWQRGSNESMFASIHTHPVLTWSSFSLLQCVTKTNCTINLCNQRKSIQLLLHTNFIAIVYIYIVYIHIIQEKVYSSVCVCVCVYKLACLSWEIVCTSYVWLLYCLYSGFSLQTYFITGGFLHTCQVCCTSQLITPMHVSLLPSLFFTRGEEKYFAR